MRHLLPVHIDRHDLWITPTVVDFVVSGGGSETGERVTLFWSTGG